MNPKLFIVTGTSGTGKSSVLPFLKESLNSSYRCYDFDELLRPYDFTDSWTADVSTKLKEIVENNARVGISTVCVGLIRPSYVKNFPIPILVCLLNVSIEERTQRLKKRGATQALIDDLEELNGLEQWIQESAFPYIKIETNNKSIKEVAALIQNWIFGYSGIL
jgi:broad-specificity NMP kinase